MRVLVTGAAGFLGSHLMVHHLNQGDIVLGVDNYCSSHSQSEHAKKIIVATENGTRGLLLRGDITHHGGEGLWGCFSTFEAAGLGNRFDLIYNFACPASPPIYQSMPVQTMMTCVAGTRAVLDMAQQHKAIVVHASTSEVYGDPDRTPQREDYKGSVNPYGPRACYDEGKRAAEALCYDYLHTHGVDARMVRIFNTYGPNMDPNDGRVVSNFICQALRGEKLTVYGDGHQSRSFCYVDDLIRGIVALGTLGQNPKGPINLGNPYEFSVGHLATVVAQKVLGDGCLPWDRSIEHQPLPVDDPMQRCPDISRARTLLNWEPKVTLDEGLTKTISYFRSIVRP